MWTKQAIQHTQYGDGAYGYLYRGDVVSLYETLNTYSGKVSVIYLDPPFLSGGTYQYKVKVGEEGYEKGKPEITLPAFSDVYPNKAAYLSMIKPILTAARELLSDDGSLFVHLDWRMSAYVRVLLDELMGEDQFVNEIIWIRETGGRATRYFSRKHDVILMYRKTRNAFFDITQAPLSRSLSRRNHMKRSVDSDGRAYRSIKSGGKQYIYYDDAPVYPSDVWADVSHLQQKDPQRTGYDTQKPVALLQRIIKTTSRPGDLTADLCFGSGTAPLVSAMEGRRFIGADLSKHALSAAGKRLSAYGFHMVREANMDEAYPEADIMSGIGLYTLSLTRFINPGITRHVPETYLENPLDTVDQWAAGFIKDGVFRAYARSVRSKLTPKLAAELTIPMLSGNIAIEIIDCLSDKHIYTYRTE